MACGMSIALPPSMTRAILSASLIASVASLALVGAARDAAACSPPPCEPARVIAAGAKVPMNAPAIPYIAPSGGGGSGTTMRLLDPGNAELPTSTAPDPWWSTGSLLTPSSPLSTGAHKLSYLETCTALGASAQGARSFEVGAATSLPTRIGTVHGGNWKVGQRSVMTSSGSCFTSLEAVTIDLRVIPSPELLAYAPITGFKVRIDGKSARSTYYGQAKTEETGIVVMQLHAVCGTRTGGDDNGVTLGEHDVEVTAHVAGAASDPPPVVRRLRFSCTDSNVETNDDAYEPENPADSGLRTEKGPDRTVNAADAGNTDNAGLPETAVAGCACTAAGASRSPGGPTFAGLLTVAALCVARTRRRATSPKL